MRSEGLLPNSCFGQVNKSINDMFHLRRMYLRTDTSTAQKLEPIVSCKQSFVKFRVVA